RVSELVSSLPAVENPSFESPAIVPNAYPVLPLVGQWTEIGQDGETSTNTGVFLNTRVDSPDHIVNANGVQIAYLGSELGNALEQDLTIMYEPGSGYRLTVGVAVSSQFPPGQENTLDLVFYYYDGNEPVDIITKAITPVGLSSTELEDVSLYLPTIQPDQAWAGYPMGVALRATGPAGGFWDLDYVRLGGYRQK
ncbi:MAG: hypothetical protein K9N55_00065, partial [Phycisphaerae bacterium]|nr:hypothetical protein [Phycisphaerae bacterium]